MEEVFILDMVCILNRLLLMAVISLELVQERICLDGNVAIELSIFW